MNENNNNVICHTIFNSKTKKYEVLLIELDKLTNLVTIMIVPEGAKITLSLSDSKQLGYSLQNILR